MYLGFGSACHMEVGGVFGQVWNRRESFLQPEPGQLAGYPDLVVTLLSDINNRFHVPYCNPVILSVLAYGNDQTFGNRQYRLHLCLIKQDPRPKIIDLALTQIFNMGHRLCHK
jgi:hypothetical protein